MTRLATYAHKASAERQAAYWREILGAGHVVTVGPKTDGRYPVIATTK